MSSIIRACIPLKTYASNVAGGSQAQSTNKTGTHVGEDITVQIGHHHDAVGVGLGVLDDLNAHQRIP